MLWKNLLEDAVVFPRLQASRTVSGTAMGVKDKQE